MKILHQVAAAALVAACAFGTAQAQDIKRKITKIAHNRWRRT